MNEATQLTLIQPEPQHSPPALTPLQLIQMATEKGADVATLERLMNLQERWEATQARKAYVEAVAAFKASPPKIQKNKHVYYKSERAKDATEYDHATLDNVVNIVTPALSTHGLSHRWETEQLDGGQIRVTCVLTHILGHSERTSLQAGRDESGGKNNIQAVGSTVSYLQRYTLLAMCGLATGDMDDDGRKGADFVTIDQADQLQAMVESTGSDKDRFLKWAGADGYATIPAAKFEAAKAFLNRKATAK